MFLFIIIGILTLPIISGNIVQAKLNTKFLNSGFHREIEYALEVNIPNSNCVFSVVQLFPPDIYVNLDQLLDLSRFGKINFYCPKFVDVELPASKSEQTKVYLFGKLNRYNIINLPIHFRYQLPGNIKFVNVILNTPTVLIRCENTHPSKSAVSAPCGIKLLTNNIHAVSTDNCLYEYVDVINEQSNLHTTIPIGNMKMKIMVNVSTILTSWLGCIYIIYSISQKKLNNSM